MGGVDPGWGVMEIAPPFLFCAFRSRVFAFRDLFRSFWVRLVVDCGSRVLALNLV